MQAIALFYRWIIHQMDIKYVFLNGWKEQPSKIFEPSKKNLACKLQKPFYGLKKALKDGMHGLISILKKQDAKDVMHFYIYM